MSYNSPIARALIGKTVGDSLVIPIPKGKVEVEITDLEFVDK
ncbi:MAG: GreA/GreB family elongation factor [bacterium]